MTSHKIVMQAQGLTKRYGQVVALDDTRTLLQLYAGKSLRLKLQPSRLPPALQPLLRAEEGGYCTLALHDVAQLEGVLAKLREGGIQVEDMQLIEADLEDVFMEIVRR